MSNVPHYLKWSYYKAFISYIVDVTGETIAKLCGLPDEMTEFQSTGNSLTLTLISDIGLSDGKYNITLSVGNMSIFIMYQLNADFPLLCEYI